MTKTRTNSQHLPVQMARRPQLETKHIGGLPNVSLEEGVGFVTCRTLIQLLGQGTSPAIPTPPVPGPARRTLRGARVRRHAARRAGHARRALRGGEAAGGAGDAVVHQARGPLGAGLTS